MADFANSFDSLMKGPGGADPERHLALFLSQVEPTEGDLLIAGNYLRGAIRERTFAGRDVNGAGFTPYSESYAKRKGQTNVDLYSRGASAHMQDALTVRVPADHSAIEVGIYGADDIALRARVHNEGGQIRTRQGRGSKLETKSQWAGLGIRQQRRGGRLHSTMPRRHWLDANEADLPKMRDLILESIERRLRNT